MLCETHKRHILSAFTHKRSFKAQGIRTWTYLGGHYSSYHNGVKYYSYAPDSVYLYPNLTVEPQTGICNATSLCHLTV